MYEVILLYQEYMSTNYVFLPVPVHLKLDHGLRRWPNISPSTGPTSGDVCDVLRGVYKLWHQSSIGRTSGD